jgi:hypothetical protein
MHIIILMTLGVIGIFVYPFINVIMFISFETNYIFLNLVDIYFSNPLYFLLNVWILIKFLIICLIIVSIKLLI